MPNATLDSHSTIALPYKDILSELVLNKAGASDKDCDIIVTQTAPTAPILLSAIDLHVGDKVRVTWSGTGPFYNVYYKVVGAGSFLRANGFPLPSSQTTYNIGGLVTGTNYIVMVRAVNGAGTESSDSNTITGYDTITSNTTII